MHRRTLAVAAAAAMVAAGLSVAAPPAAAAPAALPAFVADQLLVGYAAGATADSRESARVAVSTLSAESLVAAASDRRQVDLVTLPAGADLDAAIARLEANPAVAYAERNWKVTTAATSNDPYYTNGSLYGMYGDQTTPANQYGSQAGEAWARNITGSANVYVGIIDEGLQTTHPDLVNNVWINPFDPTDGGCPASR